MICKSWTCKRMLWCSKENICVHPREICDGILHCPLSGDDEAVCDRKCPKQCVCLGRAVLCINPTALKYNKASVVLLKMKPYFKVEQIAFENAWFIDISNSNLSAMDQTRKLKLQNS